MPVDTSNNRLLNLEWSDVSSGILHDDSLSAWRRRRAEAYASFDFPTMNSAKSTNSVKSQSRTTLKIPSVLWILTSKLIAAFVEMLRQVRKGAPTTSNRVNIQRSNEAARHGQYVQGPRASLIN